MIFAHPARLRERTPPDCSFRQPAENFVAQIIFPGMRSKISFTEVWASRPDLHAGRVRSPGLGNQGYEVGGLGVSFFGAAVLRNFW